MDRLSHPTELPEVGTLLEEELEAASDQWRVLLFNDQVHSFAEVIVALVEATGFDIQRCAKTTMEAHIAGRATVTITDEAEAERMVAVLTRAGLIAAMRRA